MTEIKYWKCDHCNAASDTPLVYRLAQITDELDEDDDQIIATYEFCTTKCLHAWAMDMALDFPDIESPTSS